MNILHLMDAASPQACPTTLALLGESVRGLSQIQHHVLLLGGRSLSESATSAGLRGIERLRVPGGRAILGLPAVARRIWRLGRVDVVHCWTPGALTVAAMLLRSVPRILTLATPAWSPDHLRMWGPLSGRRLLGHGVPAAPTIILTVSKVIRRRLVAEGVDGSVLRVLRPALNPDAANRHQRLAIRRTWGIESDQIKVFALLSDPPPYTDAIKGILSVGLAEESLSTTTTNGRPLLRLLVHPAQRGRLRAQRMMDRYGAGQRIIQEPRLAAPWQVLPGCDAALALGPHSGGLSLCWALACGLPIVADDTLHEALREGQTALIAGQGAARRVLADRLHQLVIDPDRASRMGEGAQQTARSMYESSTYARSLRQVYEQVTLHRIH